MFMQGQREEGESERGPGQKKRKRWERSVLSVLSALSSVRVRGLLPYCCWYRLVVFFWGPRRFTPTLLYHHHLASPLLSSPPGDLLLLTTTNYRLLLLLLRQQRRRRLGEEGVRARVVFYFYFLPFLFLLALYGCMYVCGDTYVDVTRYEEEGRTSKGIEESR